MDFSQRDIRRFYEKVSTVPNENGCLVWLASRFSKGYGAFWFKGYLHPASRIAFILATGEEPKLVRHTCDNPPCCNPEHLIGGDNADNMKDMIERERYIRPRGFNASIPDEVIAEIRKKYIEGTPQWMLRNEYGYSSAHISKIVRGLVR